MTSKINSVICYEVVAISQTKTNELFLLLPSSISLYSLVIASTSYYHIGVEVATAILHATHKDESTFSGHLLQKIKVESSQQETKAST